VFEGSASIVSFSMIRGTLMSERIVKCPSCQSTSIEVSEVHNHNTTGMNSNVTLRCTKCQHSWEGQVTSDYSKKMRDLGWRR
jgi:transposase-like protein